MKKRGFTLIELLAVIAIIGVLAAIIYPSITGVMKKSKVDAYGIQIEEIEKAAGRWALKNASIMPATEGSKITIYIRDLKKGGVLDKNLKDPKTKKKFPDDMEIVITRKGNTYTYVVNTESGTVSEDIDMGVGSLILNGLPYEYIEINTAYTDKGAKGIDKKGSIVPESSISKVITKDGVVVSSITTSALKEYEITYKMSEQGKLITVKRTVKIRDITPPKLTIPLNTTLSSTAQSFDINGGVSAVDNSGERITVESKGNVTLGVPGTYVIVYSAKDSSGNETVKKRTVTIVGDICTIVKVTGSTKTGISTQANVTLTAGTPNGGTPEDTTYQWQKLINGVWMNVAGATNRVYTETTEIHMKYRVMYKQYTCSSYSNEYEVYIDRTPPVCPTFTGSKNPDTWSKENIELSIMPSADTANYELAVSHSGGIYNNVGTKKGKFTQVFGSDAARWRTRTIVRDRADNKQTCYSNEYYIDKTPPTCTNSGGNKNWINTDLTITGTCADNLSGCTGNATRSYTTNTHTSTASPGTVYDNAGNSRVCAGDREVHIDQVAPNCSSSGGSDWTKNNVIIVGTCTDDFSGCQGNISKSYSWNMNSTTESPGTVSDKAGNTKACPNQTVKIDKSAPSCTSSGGNTSWVKTDITLIGTCADTGGSGCAGNARKSYTTDTNISNVSPGTISDNVGNTVTCPGNQTVKIDKIAPTCDTSYVNLLTCKYSFAGYESVSYSLKDKATLIGTCVDKGSGCVSNVSKEFTQKGEYNTTMLVDGKQVTNYANGPGTVVDNAGNSTKCNPKYTFTVDQDTPVIYYNYSSVSGGVLNSSNCSYNPNCGIDITGTGGDLRVTYNLGFQDDGPTGCMNSVIDSSPELVWGGTSYFSAHVADVTGRIGRAYMSITLR